MTVEMTITTNGETWKVTAPKSKRFVRVRFNPPSAKVPIALVHAEEPSNAMTRVQKQVATKVT